MKSNPQGRAGGTKAGTAAGHGRCRKVECTRAKDMMCVYTCCIIRSSVICWSPVFVVKLTPMRPWHSRSMRITVI